MVNTRTARVRRPSFRLKKFGAEWFAWIGGNAGEK